MNILCLHGCRQTKEIFKKLLKISVIKSENNFFFIDGLYNHSQHGKMWYEQELQIKDIGVTIYDPKTTVKTMEQINNSITENKINMLFGFSQGANVIDTYLQLTHDKRIEKAILISGYSFTGISRNCLTPVTTVHSIVDNIVDPKYNPKFIKSKCIVHNNGHKLVLNKTMRNQLNL